MIGVASAKVAIEAVVGMVGSVLDIVQGGISVGDLPKLIKLFTTGKRVVSNASLALKEVEDLDEKEAAELGRAVYEAVLQVLEVVADYKNK